MIGGITALGCVGTLDGREPLCDYNDMVKIFDYGTPIFNSSKYLGLWNNIMDKAKNDQKGIEIVEHFPWNTCNCGSCKKRIMARQV